MLAPYVNSFGKEYVQFFQRIPLGEYLYTSYEKNFLAGPGITWVKAHPWTPSLICVAYLALVFGGQRVMRDRKPFKLVNTLALWNFSLSLFSFLGASRTVPHLVHNIMSRPFDSTICTVAAEDWGDGATGLWVQLFIFSKVPELVDTAFIVLRKKPLIFLHWYHHVTVLLYCWHSCVHMRARAPRAPNREISSSRIPLRESLCSSPPVLYTSGTRPRRRRRSTSSR